MNKILMGAAVFLTLVLTGCLSPEKAIEKFETSVAEANAEELFKLVHVEEDVHWTEKEAKDLIDYFAENESAYTEQLRLLHEQKDAFKEKKAPANTTGIVYFNDKKKLFVRAYEVVLSKDSFVAFDELVVTIPENAEVKREGGSKENIALGLFGPGNYEIAGKADYGYVLLEDQVDLGLFAGENFTEEILLDLKGEGVAIYSTQPDAALYIDGKKVEQDISVSGGAMIQPLIEGLSLQSKSEFAWGELVSEEVPFIGEGTRQENYAGNQQYSDKEIDLTPHIFSNEQEKAEIAEMITDFNEKLLKALAENDPDIVKDVMATEEAIAGYDEDFALLDAVEKGDVTASSFPPGAAIAFIGNYQGGLLESIIDFTHAENEQDEETGEDLLAVRVNLRTDFFYIPKGYDAAQIVKNGENYLEPIIQLKKEGEQWVIARQLIYLKDSNNELNLPGKDFVRTKVK